MPEIYSPAFQTVDKSPCSRMSRAFVYSLKPRVSRGVGFFINIEVYYYLGNLTVIVVP